MKEKFPSSSEDPLGDEQIARQIDHVMDTRGVSYEEARKILGISSEDELARRALAKSQHPAGGARRPRTGRPPVGEDSVWAPVGELSAAEEVANQKFVEFARGVLSDLHPEAEMTPFERAQKRAREERRKRKS